MLSDQEFNDWCRGVNLPQAARQLISQIRASEPIRRVKSSGINVRGDYASRKMGKTIQFESHKIELPGVEEYEEDADVLEYYDQAYQITLECLFEEIHNLQQEIWIVKTLGDLIAQAPEFPCPPPRETIKTILEAYTNLI